MKKFLIAILFTIIALTANAAKSTGEVHIFQQPDGTKVAVQLLGDEYFSWHQTPDGILLTYADKAYYIANTDSLGNLINSGILAHNADARTEKEIAAIKKQNRSLFFNDNPDLVKAKSQRRVIADYPKSYFCPHSGTIHVPVIMMEYSDMPITFTDRRVWAEYFNGTNSTPYSTDTRFQGYSSVKQYFADASNGKLDFVFDIYGPYKANGTHDSYGYGKELTVMKEAVTLANADIDFSKYDSNNDGRVDMVYVLYAGTGRNLSSSDLDLHPQCYHTSGTFITVDGKSINILGCANELAVRDDKDYGSLRAGIGVTCHEISHGLGLPDLYWTLDSTPTDERGNTDWNNCGPEDWDLMDGGENLYNAMWPCQYAAWERDVLGWIDVEELTEPQTVTLYPLNKEGGKAYRVTNPANRNEYYIIEYYQYDEWNYYITQRKYCSGLMITHVNATSSGLSMAPNNTYGKPNVTILPADGNIIALYSARKGFNTMDEYKESAMGDPYPGAKNVTSVAAYKNYTGEEMAGKYPITDITRNPDFSISFNFMGGTTPTAITNLDDPDHSSSAIYSIDGLYVGTSTTHLPHGIYIRNGKKYVK